MYKIVDELIFLFWGFSLKILFGSSLHVVNIRIFIVGYEKECEKSFFYKIGGFGEWLATRMSHKFQSPTNRKVRLYFFSYSDPVVMTLQLPACFTHVTLLASQLRVPVVRMLLNAHTWSIFHTLSHITLILFPLKYRVSNCWITNKFVTE